MKVFRFILLSSLILMLSFNVLATDRKSKHALIIAVANYPKNTGWSSISSDNDVVILKDALLRQGFKKENITIIIDNDARKQNILNQLKHLTDKVNVGDIVVIHFSGHGQQIIDDNGDEPDGYDESLIPYDAQMRYSNSYKGESHLRDDEFRLILTQLRHKLGKTGNVFVILDSCHSGTGTRGYQKSRGTQVKFQPNGYNPQNITENRALMDLNEASVVNNHELAGLVTFSASGPEQLNFEYTDKETETSYGSLSYAFCNALSGVDSTTTYRGLFDQILVNMSSIAPKQNPQAEGDLDQLLFNGQSINILPYFKIINETDINTYTLSGGNLLGIYDGAEISLYDIDTYNYIDAEPKAMGKVINSSILLSEIKIEGIYSNDDIKNSWAYITKQTFGKREYRIGITKIKDKNLKKLLESIFETNDRIIVSNDLPDIIIEGNNKKNTDSLFFYTKDDLLLASFKIGDKNYSEIEQIVINEIKKSFQANFLRSLNLSTREFDISFKIIPITLKSQGAGYIEDKELSLKEFMSITNQLEFKDGSAFKLSIKSSGYNKAFYQILDIQPDNKINILIPTNHNKPSDYIIYPGEEIELNEIFVIGKPYGKEVFKLIATSEPIDLSLIIQTRGQSQLNFNSPFEILFNDTYNLTRGASLAIPPETVSTYSVVFEIVGD